jgi:hypothetical protein
MIRGLFGVAVFLLAIHVGYIFLSPSIENRMLQGKMEEVSRNRTLRSDQAVRRQVIEFIREKGIPLSPEDLVITMGEDGTSIAAYYKVTSRFWFYERDEEFYPASSSEARLTPRRVQQVQANRRSVRAGH